MEVLTVFVIITLIIIGVNAIKALGKILSQTRENTVILEATKKTIEALSKQIAQLEAQRRNAPAPVQAPQNTQVEKQTTQSESVIGKTEKPIQKNEAAWTTMETKQRGPEPKAAPITTQTNNSTVTTAPAITPTTPSPVPGPVPTQQPREEVKTAQPVTQQGTTNQTTIPSGPAPTQQPKEEVKTAQPITQQGTATQTTSASSGPAPMQQPKEEVKTAQSVTQQGTTTQTTSTASGSAPKQQTGEGIKTAQPGIQQKTAPQTNTAKGQPFNLGKANAPIEKKAEKKTDYERFIGENLFGKIGILIFILGVGFFVKYAIDQNWISETMRTVLGFAVGFALFGVGHKLRKEYSTFSSLLVGGSFAIFFITDAIAYHYYGLFTTPVAFTILLVSMLLMVALAIIYNKRELAIIALIGGFIAPFIVGISINIGILVYILILNLGMFTLSMFKRWSELPILSFVATTVIMCITVFGIISKENVMQKETFIFVSIFYLTFILPIFYILRFHKEDKMNIPLVSSIISNNFVYFTLGLVLISNMDLTFNAKGWLCLFIALVNTGIYFWMCKAKHEFLKSVSIALTIIFAALFVPMQFDSSVIHVAWAAEMVATLWLFIKTKNRLFEYGSLAYLVLTNIAFYLFLIGFDDSLSFMNTGAGSDYRMFANGTFVSNIFTAIAFLVSGLLMNKYKQPFEKAMILDVKNFVPSFFVLAVATTYLTFLYELMSIQNEEVRHAAIALLTTAIILVMSFALKFVFDYKKNYPLYIFFMLISIVTLAIGALSTVPPLESQAFTLWILSIVATFLCMTTIAINYYKAKPFSKGFTVLLNIMGTLAIILTAFFISVQLGHSNFSMAFSFILGVIGFIQMCIGMKIHMKVMRIISLYTFAIVLIKLVVVDLWSMASLGKIIVLVSLGLILLTLSFLYQKLKNVIFQDEQAKDPEKIENTEVTKDTEKTEEKEEAENTKD
ncbi:MAG: DUF2339 domain-containing protein [Paludibacteraceae bacterium]|nr:DUF2339 domain-containing protein [Paludibacteraceae bacterium]